ncbi:MAG TPA: hypothetical protein VHU40_19120 [Polyangia bacterium]|nr:hypothetical protein [Polyangia bacterium]
MATDVSVELGGRLEVGAGVIARFARGKGLYVHGGQLIVRGSATEPVTFTSASDAARPGDWCGLIFDSFGASDRTEPLPGSTLEHVVVEFGGHPWAYPDGDKTAAGIAIVGYPRSPEHGALAAPVTLKDVEIRNNQSSGIDVQTNSVVTAERLVFGRNGGVSMRIDVGLAEQLAGAATETVELVGNVRRSVQLPRLLVPYVVVDSLQIGKLGGPPSAILTIPPGTVLKFRRGTDLRAGGYFFGGLVAHGVTFTSAEADPQPGDWGGIFVVNNASADLSDDTIEYAGAFDFPALFAGSKRLNIKNTRFRRNAGPSVGEPISCAKWRNPALKNVFEDQRPCVTTRRR